MNQDKSIFLLLSSKIIIIIIVFLIIGIFFTNNIIVYVKGLTLGGIFSILKIKLMEDTIKKSIKKDPRSASTYANLHYFFRYILTFLLLVVSILEPSISFVGVVLGGVISMKIAAYWQGYKEPITPKDGSVQFLEWEDDEEESDF